MQKIDLDGKEIAIVINNTCNLTCENCITLSNLQFPGTYKWEDYSHFLELWASKVNFPVISLMGGEPFLNKDLLDWAFNVRSLWPNSEIDVLTNGSLLHLTKNIDVCHKLLEMGIAIKISCHSPDEIEANYKNVERILSNYIYETKDFTDFVSSRKYFIDGKLVFEVAKFYYFAEPFYTNARGNVINFDIASDPKLSWDKCLYKKFMHMLRGKIYYCVAMQTYADGKNHFIYPTEVVKSFEEYKPCSPFDDYENIKKFFDELSQPISQCSHCAMDKKLRPFEFYIPINLI